MLCSEEDKSCVGALKGVSGTAGVVRQRQKVRLFFTIPVRLSTSEKSFWGIDDCLPVILYDRKKIQ